MIACLRATGAWAGASLLLLTACTAGTPQPTTNSERLLDPAISLGRALETHASRQDSIQTCMKAQGFAYEPEPAPDQAPVRTAAFDRTLDEARESGYGLVEGFEAYVAELRGETPPSDVVPAAGRGDFATSEEFEEYLRELDTCRTAADDPSRCSSTRRTWSTMPGRSP